jgi:hypothetical protein
MVGGAGGDSPQVKELKAALEKAQAEKTKVTKENSSSS